ncbi:MAG: hypothetical protein JJE03_03010 [Peptostreptococcaceae bacterium]|nr:hypothetical protein [Peptostreptococcaceae bacterium]
MEYVIGIGTLVLAAVGLVWSLHSNIEFKKYQEKQRVYNNYFENISASLLLSSRAERKKVARRQMLNLHEIALRSPKEIVDMLADVQPLDFYTTKPTTEEEEKKFESYCVLFNLMRKDLDKNNKDIDKEKLKKLFLQLNRK